MTWKGPDDRTEFPTLGLVVDAWVIRHCVVPDGFKAGEPFVFSDQQFAFSANHYRLKRDAQPAWLWAEDDDEERDIAFTYRRSQLVRAQKWGKNPLVAAFVCVEGVGPALFSGWAGKDDGWACADHGCPCGWEYPYEPGDPMAMCWPTPLIQITATSEDATDNTYDALRPMIEKGRLADVILKTGEEFIRLPGGGRIDVVTSNARSRLGQRVTFCPQDETGMWTPITGMVKVAHTQRRGLAAMGGRAIETTNAWDPAENSIAQQTFESKAPDIHRDYRRPPGGLSYTNKAERRKIHKFNYAGCPWVVLSGIEGEAAELLEVDAPQAERFFGNRILPGGGAAFDPDRWASLSNTSHVVADKTMVTVGVRGERFSNSLVFIVTDIAAGYQWCAGMWERPPAAPDDYEHPVHEVDTILAELFDRFTVLRAYVGAGLKAYEDRWAGIYNADRLAKDARIISWDETRVKLPAIAVRNFAQALTSKQRELTHDGGSAFKRHIENARKKPVTTKDDEGRPLWVIQKANPQSPLYVDGAWAAVLSWEARGDAIAAGIPKTKKRYRARGF